MQNIEEIYNDYFKIVKKYLFCLTGNNDIAEELTQETFYKAMLKINTFKGNCKMSVWLCQIAKNLWYNELKKNKKIKNVTEEELTEIEISNTLEDIVFSNEEKSKLYEKIQLLDNQTKQVVLLRIMGELSFKEIGNILGRNENWARVTFYRGKQKLKEGDLYE